MDGDAPHSAGGRTKTDLRRGKLSEMTEVAGAKAQRATTNAEQDFLLGRDVAPAPPPSSSEPGEIAK